MQETTFGKREPIGGAGAPAACCRACGEPLRGAFCSACGQAAQRADSVLDVVRDLLQRLTRYDRRFWRTFPLLVWDPGRLSREWNEGARAGRLSPLHLALFCAFLFCVAPVVAGLRNYAVDADGPVGLADAAAATLRSHALVFVCGMAPALALILTATGFGRGYRLYHHLTVALHEIAFLLLLGAFALVMLALRTRMDIEAKGFLADAPFALTGLAVLTLPVHLAAHLIGAYRHSVVVGIARTAAVGFMALVVFQMVDVAGQAFIHEPVGRPPADLVFTRAPAVAHGA